jgi:outer membrane biosynthesis protein TonB
MAEHRMTPEQVRQMTGVDRLPHVLDQTAFAARIEGAYPAELRAEGVAGSALVDVLIDEGGRVASVIPIDRPAGMRALLILEGEDGSQRRVTPEDHPAFQKAAASALRDVRFSPAIRDGQPVPFTMRMTVNFEPSARKE